MRVAEIFNKMASDYDEIHDLWYAWLFSRLHYIITTQVICKYKPTTVLDVGCGTGLQSLLHASFGASVVGGDIAKDLVKMAQKKAKYFNPRQDLSLFPAHFEFVTRYSKIIEVLFNQKKEMCVYTTPRFQIFDARYLPFPNETFDHVNCCGSTLSFIKSPNRALFEMVRVLKPGGTLFLEIESRWNLDLFWVVFDAILKGKLGYNTPLIQALKTIFISPKDNIQFNYPFDDYEDKDHVVMKLHLFTKNQLEKIFSALHLSLTKSWSIHSITNLIPSKCLGRSDSPRWVRRLFTLFANIEERLSINPPGNSLVMLAHKINK
jgi:ubiquinone/menaquinone biosynthesis C-methylase UbiE